MQSVIVNNDGAGLSLRISLCGCHVVAVIMLTYMRLGVLRSTCIMELAYTPLYIAVWCNAMPTST